MILAFGAICGCISPRDEQLPSDILKAGNELARQTGMTDVRFYKIDRNYLESCQNLDIQHLPLTFFVCGHGWETNYMKWFPDKFILARVGSKEQLEEYEKVWSAIADNKIKRIIGQPTNPPYSSPRETQGSKR